MTAGLHSRSGSLGRRRGAEGFTLIELVVVVLLMLVVSALSVSLMRTGFRSSSLGRAVVDAGSELALAQDVLHGELRTAGLSPDGVATPDTVYQNVTTLTQADRLSFITDVDSNGVSDLVTYRVAGTTLERIVRPRIGGAWGVGAPVVLVDGLERFQLVFLDEDRNALVASDVEADAARVRAIRWTLSAERAGPNGAVLRTSTGEVAMRNR